jgi:predicted chitinase
MTTLTKRINGGTHGIDDRIARTQHAIDVLMA